MVSVRVDMVNFQSRAADRILKVRWKTKHAEEVGVERAGSGRDGLGLGLIVRVNGRYKVTDLLCTIRKTYDGKAIYFI
jgi:hypothetical protein